MTQVNIHEAKTQLSKLIERAEAGEEIILARAGTPVVRLTLVTKRPELKPGLLQGVTTVPDDFDAPLDDETLRSFGIG